MTNQELIAKFEELGALQQGHFKLTSGLHSEQYMQCAKLFEYPLKATEIVANLATKLPQGIETIIAPAIGGITVGYELAKQLDVRFIFAERQDGKMTLRRGFSLKPGEKVLAAEDVVTTGGSVQEVVNLAEEYGAKILGVASLVDRSEGKADFKVPFYSLVNMEIKVFNPKECPLCSRNVPLNSPGSRNS